MTSPFLVLGATGTTGRRVVHRLAGRGVAIRPGSRRATPPFDWTDRSTWAPALHGVAGAYVSFQPDLAVPGAAEAVGAFAQAARAAGVERAVLLSGRGEPEARGAEQALRDHVPHATIVRSSFFAQNFSEGIFAGAVTAGRLALPVDGVPEPFVDADDVADVAVAALLDAEHAGATYEVTGPRLLAFPEAVAEIADAAGRPVVFESVHPDAFAADVGPELGAMLTALFADVLDGRNAHLTDGVQRALGRPPRDFAAFAAAAAQGGAWDAD